MEAPANFQFLDMGYDPVNDEVAMVGTVDGFATVFELNAEQDQFNAQTLANLPGATSSAEVFGISSDGSRIAGISPSADSVSNEGTTWLRISPSQSAGIGFISGLTNNSSAAAAWSGGVVGNSAGQIPITWDTENEIQTLPGTENGLSSAEDVTQDGEISVGSSTHEVFDGAAYFWDSTGINRLNDTVAGFTIFNSIAQAISPDGNFIGGEIRLIDEKSNFINAVAIWEGPERTLRVLTDNNGNLINGIVSDISNSGYAVGTFTDESFNPFAFIWNPDFELSGTPGVRPLELWLEEEFGMANLPFPPVAVMALAEGNGKLFFNVSGFKGNQGFSALIEIENVFALGDVNRDGNIDLLDVAPFVELILSGEFQFEADLNQDSTVDLLDIGPFVNALSG